MSYRTETHEINGTRYTRAVDGTIVGYGYGGEPIHQQPAPQRSSTAASEAQLNFISTLMTDRAVDALKRTSLELELSREVSKKRASEIITDLKAFPRNGGAAATTGTSEAAPEGVYELDGTFYAVRASRQNPDRRAAYKAIITDTAVDFDYSKGTVYHLGNARLLDVAEIEAMSLQFCRCMLCGYKLKAKDSKAKGIGPVCRKKIEAATLVG